MPGPRVRVAKDGVNVITGSLVDMAFDSDYNLNKIARTIKSASNGSTAHGLTYIPKILNMREAESGRFAWMANTTVGATNINATKGTHYTSHDPDTLATDTANWTHVLVDNLSTGTYKKDMKRTPAILVGADTGTDYGYKLHSGYDTFKVAKTGTLTINASAYDPGSGGGVSVSSATYTHNLGYAPMFAPFVPYETDLWFYYMANAAFDTSIVNGGVWLTATEYKTGEDVLSEDFLTWYNCKQTHTSSAATKPGSGASWTTYWELWQDPDFTETYVNDLEDIKLNLWVFGDEGDHNYYYIKYYSTSTQLVLEVTRVVSPSIPDFYEYTPEPASTWSVDYTIFYNPAGEEFNLL